MTFFLFKIKLFKGSIQKTLIFHVTIAESDVKNYEKGKTVTNYFLYWIYVKLHNPFIKKRKVIKNDTANKEEIIADESSSSLIDTQDITDSTSPDIDE